MGVDTIALDTDLEAALWGKSGAVAWNLRWFDAWSLMPLRIFIIVSCVYVIVVVVFHII